MFPWNGNLPFQVPKQCLFFTTLKNRNCSKTYSLLPVLKNQRSLNLIWSFLKDSEYLSLLLCNTAQFLLLCLSIFFFVFSFHFLLDHSIHLSPQFISLLSIDGRQGTQLSSSIRNMLRPIYARENSIWKKIAFKKNLFICLLRVLFAARGVFSCGMQTLSCGHVGFSSLTRDWTQDPCIGSTES